MKENFYQKYINNISESEFMKIFTVKLSAKIFIISEIMELLLDSNLKVKVKKNIAIKYLNEEKYIFCEDSESVCVSVVDLIELKGILFNDVIVAISVFSKETGNVELVSFFINLLELLNICYFENRIEDMKNISKELLK